MDLKLTVSWSTGVFVSQAYPALELTLTDRAGNIISRRVVTPDKYLPRQDSLEMKPNAAVDISIRFRTPSIRVDGFELRPVSQNWLERNRSRETERLREDYDYRSALELLQLCA